MLGKKAVKAITSMNVAVEELVEGFESVHDGILLAACGVREGYKEVLKSGSRSIGKGREGGHR